jgi:glucokinase
MTEISDLKRYGLAADIGGTHTRFATVDLARPDAPIGEPETFAVKDYAGVVEAVRAYLAGSGLKSRPEALVFAVAGPVRDGRIHFTNSGWAFSEEELRDKLGVQRAKLINDFEAQARAVPLLAPASLIDVGPAHNFDAKADGTIALIGPGTGLGVGGFVRAGKAGLPLVTEGGHVSLAPGDELEIEILKFLMRRFGRVSAERVLCGPGLVNLHDAMAQIEGIAREDVTPEEITAHAKSDPKSFSARVFMRFCAILGAVAGDFALAFGARQGVLIAGGILPDAVDVFLASPFRARFEAKGRFTDYVSAIPTLLIVEPRAGLIGAASLLRDAHD